MQCQRFGQVPEFLFIELTSGLPGIRDYGINRDMLNTVGWVNILRAYEGLKALTEG